LLDCGICDDAIKLIMSYCFGNKYRNCEHICDLCYIDQCCDCGDKRKRDKKGMVVWCKVYRDGVGDRTIRQKHWRHYCPTCKIQFA